MNPRENYSSDKKYFLTIVHAEQWWIDRARNNPAFFMQYITEMEPPKHHLEWLYYIFSPDYPRVNIVAFPGSGKTHTTVYALGWLIGKRPWSTNIICSVSSDQAKDRLAAVKELVTINERYKNVFPWIQLDRQRRNNSEALNVWSTKWKDPNKEMDYTQWRSLVAKFGEPKDNTLFASGITSKSVIGKRVTGLLVIDDPHDEENSATPEQRQKIVKFFKNTLTTRLVPESNAKIVIINTRWNEDDLAGTVMDEKRKDGTPIWKTCVTPIEDEDEVPVWPEVWNKNEVEKRADEMGGKESPMYMLAYLNNTLGASLGEITKDMIKPIPHNIDYKQVLKEIVITCDFARSKKLRSDYIVFNAIGRSKERIFDTYVLDIMRFKEKQTSVKCENLSEFFDKIYENFPNINISKVVFEEADSTAEESYMRENYPDIPIEVIKTKGDKEERFKSVAYRCQIGRFYANTSMKSYHAMVNEMIVFPGGKHDDICDTLSLAFQLSSWRTIRLKAGRKVAKSVHFI